MIFLNAFLIGNTPQLIFSAAGLALVFILYFSKKDFWLLLSCLFLAVFQFLILISWDNMKYGMILNTILLVAVLVAFQRRRFSGMVRSEGIELFKSGLIARPVITAESLRDLPPIVRKWLIRSNVIGKPPIQTLCIKQKGMMRTTPKGKWLPFRAEQYVNAENQGFIWKALVDSGFILTINARDKYHHGHGNMLIKAMYTIPIADNSGPEIDQGTLMRFLAEIIWFPTAALARYVSWEYLSETSARATIDNGITSVSGIFTFDSNGDVKGFEGMRYRDINHQYQLEKWIVSVKSHRLFGGFRIADKSEVSWQQGTETFTWLKIELSKMMFTYGRQGVESTDEKVGEIRQEDLQLK